MTQTSHSAQPGQPDPSSDPTTGALVSRLSEDVSRLIRDELRLAQAEMTTKAKHAGIGIGLFGTAGMIAFYAGGVLIATAILALALVLDAWLAALIVGVVLLAAAGIAALFGKKQVDQATPAIPTETVASVQRDVDAVKKGAHR